MKKYCLRFVRIVLYVLMVLSLISVLVLPAFAFPPSFDDTRVVPPFQMVLKGDVRIDTGVLYPFQVSFPSIPYDAEQEGSFGTYAYFISEDITVDYSTIDYNLPLTDTVDSNSVMQFSFNLSCSGEYALGFDDTYNLALYGTFLNSDYSIEDNMKDSMALKVYDGGDLIEAYGCYGDFFIPRIPDYRFQFYRDGDVFLSYYDVLYHSDVDFLRFLPIEYDSAAWSATYQSFADADFSNLTLDQNEQLAELFEWVGPIYGDFGFRIDSSAYYLEWTMEYVLIDADNFMDYFQISIDNASGDEQIVGLERLTLWLGRAVQGFFSVQIMPDFSLGSILIVIIAYSLVLWWLKVFAGG